MARKKPHNSNVLTLVLTVLIITMIAATGVVIYLCIALPMTVRSSPEPTTVLDETVTPETAPTETEPPETTLPTPEHVVSTATVGAMGDLLMHKPIFDDLTEYNAAVQKADGSYDFTSVFQYLADSTAPLDYVAANLEVTLCGEDNGYAYGHCVRRPQWRNW